MVLGIALLLHCRPIYICLSLSGLRQCLFSVVLYVLCPPIYLPMKAMTEILYNRGSQSAVQGLSGFLEGHPNGPYN
jgi:hypothetical protein